MFSLDNFLFDHQPAKSRVLFNELYDPSLAYWPDEDCLRKRSSKLDNLRSRNSYNRWINTLFNEVVDASNEIDMEIECELPKHKKCSEDKLESNGQQLKLSNDKKSEMDNCKAIQSKPTEFSLRLNQYKPDDITVNVKDNQLTIKGKNEKKNGTTYSLNMFERTITLPRDVDAKNILCSMDANGLIKLNIPRKKLEDEVKEIKINIEKSSDETHKKDEPIIEPTKPVDDEPIIEDLAEE